MRSYKRYDLYFQFENVEHDSDGMAESGPTKRMKKKINKKKYTTHLIGVRVPIYGYIRLVITISIWKWWQNATQRINVNMMMNYAGQCRGDSARFIIIIITLMCTIFTPNKWSLNILHTCHRPLNVSLIVCKWQNGSNATFTTPAMATMLCFCVHSTGLHQFK